MLKFFLAFVIAFVSIGFSIDEAEAARFGGRRSFGMQRQMVTPRPAPRAPSAAPGAPRRSLMGPIAGLAAGLGIAALLSHFGMGAGMANLLTLALLVMAAVAIFKWLARKSAAAQARPSPHDPLRYAGADPHRGPAVQEFPQGATSPPTGASVPAGFDSEAFIRVAKLNFIRLQAANDEKNFDDIREFVSPEVFAEIKVQLDERGDEAQQTDVVTLDAELLEVLTEGNRHVASVHFSGMIRERVGAAAEPFAEVWNLSKPIAGERGWVISGIQQIS